MARHLLAGCPPGGSEAPLRREPGLALGGLGQAAPRFTAAPRGLRSVAPARRLPKTAPEGAQKRGTFSAPWRGTCSEAAPRGLRSASAEGARPRSRGPRSRASGASRVGHKCSYDT
eukprot:7479690-Alexandrium_andersonii.AAC.1